MIVPYYDSLLLPGTRYHLAAGTLNREEAEKVKEQEDIIILLPLLENKERERLTIEDFYEIGLYAKIEKTEEIHGSLWLEVITGARAKRQELSIEEGRIRGKFLELSEEDASEAEKKELLSSVVNTAAEMAGHFQGGEQIAQYLKTLSDVNEAVSFLSQFLGMSPKEKYDYLKIDSCKVRILQFYDAMLEMKSGLDLHLDLTERYNRVNEKPYRMAELRKRIQALQEELDSLDEEKKAETDLFGEKIEAARMPAETKEEVQRIFRRFVQMPKEDHEYGMLYEYLRFVTDLPWGAGTQQEIELKKARKVLDENHYGLDKVKERILQHLAVMALTGGQNGSIILLEGAPGTGKTSIGKSVAQALGRAYVRISLGGIKDEAEIRGHRRTYVGAMPGRILEGIRRGKTTNPVIVLDEVDKLERGYNGDPGSALLEVLDPEQNRVFTDHYLNAPYDLSQVLFICTANQTETIPRPLLDRMEVIHLSGYTPQEKLQIAKRHLLPHALKDCGIEKCSLNLPKESLLSIIENYTMESGVRGLKKQLDVLCRKMAVQMLEKKRKRFRINPENLVSYLGMPLAEHEKGHGDNPIGVTAGLAWTEAGGEILYVETAMIPGNGDLQLTGNLGDVMKESAVIALTMAKRFLKEREIDYSKWDIHIHVPQGAVPKDGPSAGITIFTALYSLLTERKTDPQLAMTGEISLRGHVLPIGGLPEKLMAAQRAGMKRVLIPRENEKELREVPEEIRKELHIIPVETVKEVLDYAVSLEESRVK